jgi:hypothetical protein
MVSSLASVFASSLALSSYTAHYKELCKKRGEVYDKKFSKFMDQVEELVYNETGVGLLDLPDQPYRVMYDDGYTVLAVKEVLIDEFNSFRV